MNIRSMSALAAMSAIAASAPTNDSRRGIVAPPEVLPTLGLGGTTNRMRSANTSNKDRGASAIAKRRRQSKQAKLSRRKNR